MTEQLYTRQLPVLELQIPNDVAIIGCGGVGSWVGIFTAMTGVKNISLFDSDKIEEHNLNRLPYSYHEVGEEKTVALKKFINHIRPECVIRCFDKINEINIGYFNQEHIDVFMVCTDNIHSQVMMQNYCKKHKRRFIRVGYDGNHVTLLNHIPTWVGKKEEVGGYTVVPSWVSPPAMIASLAVYSMCRKRLKITGTMDNVQAFEKGEAKRIDDNDNNLFRTWENSNFTYSQGYGKRKRR